MWKDLVHRRKWCGTAADYFNDTNVEVTFFAPTNAAWAKRLPSLTRPYNLTVPDLFTTGREPIMDSIMKYHMMQSAYAVGRQRSLP